MFGLTGRIALVPRPLVATATSLRERLGGRRWPVVACARRVGPLEELERSDDRITAAPLDVADVDGRARVIRQIISDHGRVDILVNNAGLRTGPASNRSRRLGMD